MKKQKLNCENARNISIVKTLGKFGHFPKKESEKEAWFLSPFRSETEASFKVSLALNRWYDHGIGKGGNIIDLIMTLNSFSVKQTLNFLNNDFTHFSFHQQSKKKSVKEINYKINEVKEIQHKALIDYLLSRKINITIAKKYCKEIHYELNSKKYFAIAFENDKHGYEIRNKYIKGNLVNKNISTIKNNSTVLNIFEGFIDFLSYLTLKKKKQIIEDFLILNSISSKDKCIEIINSYNQVNGYLDNDEPGKEASNFFKKHCMYFFNCSVNFKKFKDLNEYLISKNK